jgi:hypothetical protein
VTPIQYPFVSSEVETPGAAMRATRLSTSLEATGNQHYPQEQR